MKNGYILILILTTQLAFGQIKLPALVGDNMVLQRDKPTKIWGWASPGEKIRIESRSKVIKTQSDKTGKWTAQLPAFAAGGPYDIRINDVVIHNVLWGDVWLCAGQSNMVLPMERVKELYAEEIEKAQYPQIRNFFIPTISSKMLEKTDLPKSVWQETNPKNVLSMGAVSYFFAKKLFEKNHIPIGIINASVGGSPIESWLSLDQLKQFPAYQQDTAAAQQPAALSKALPDKGLTETTKWYEVNYQPQGWKNYFIPGFWEDQGLRDLNGVVWFRKEIELTAEQVNQSAKIFMGRIVDADEMYVNGTRIGNITYQYPPRRYEVKPGILHAGKNILVIRVTNQASKGGFVPDKRYELQLGNESITLIGQWQYKVGSVWNPNPIVSTAQMYSPTALYNGMIAPLIPYGLKGILWYQGESNTGKPDDYKDLLKALAANWRAKFQQEELPFLYAQLPGFGDRQFLPVESNWAQLREAQRKAETEIPNSRMVVAIDLGEWNDIHPLRKKPLGERFADAVTKEPAGPQIKKAIRKENKIELEFKPEGGPLKIDKSDENELQYFAIAGKDRKFVWAKAHIENNKLIVSSEEVKEPVYVRYAWSENPEGNLTNETGLPAGPFEIEAN
ncbi:sialate O-acetylesterase [Aquirufa regiilacus]|uniref:Sialate O-acetylesterase n=1 Tax=Aquirufa regiilacus TaxID=3024868 RepID=A0ABU3TTL6_9BACT|nr:MULTISPECIES: sialate O-acetylesterase [unclassified Aquirufa]MDT8886146.1 sialate O-acetylesterase [Aquirufa sp. LEPPI-3A]MDU0809208.1 sialate O-acetylesterase [Aquirufa sp. LEOWEIH-7C]